MRSSLETNKPGHDYRDDLKKAIQDSHNRLMRVINGHTTVTEEPINADDLESFPIGVWIEINDLIKAKKRNNRFLNYLNFDVCMKPGAKFSEHFHTDIVESTEIIKGEMHDVTSGIVYKVGDVANYAEGIKHTPIANEETILHVLFKKQKK